MGTCAAAVKRGIHSKRPEKKWTGKKDDRWYDLSIYIDHWRREDASAVWPFVKRGNLLKSALELLMIHNQSDPSAVSTVNVHCSEHQEQYTRNMESSNAMKDDRRRSDENINKIVRHADYIRKSKDFVLPSIPKQISCLQGLMDHLVLSWDNVFTA